MKKPLGIYIHLPFCVERCNYCDFLTFPHAEKHHEPYVQALVEDIRLDSARRRLDAYEVNSVFLGGGTPSLLNPDQLKRIFTALADAVVFAPSCEVTIEANPATLDGGKVEAFRQVGINRVSLGIQSMNQDLLDFCLRTHKPVDVVRDVDLLRSQGIDNINFDLIHAIPGQTEADILEDLAWIEKLKPGHVSWYSLIIEERTLLHHQIEQGMVEPLAEDLEVSFFELIQSRLKELGYRQYENSNFALEGRESVHNLKYWSNQDYWGVGLGASSYLGGERYKVTTSLMRYMALVADGEKTWVREERTKRDDLFEQVMMGLRKKRGINLAAFREKNGLDILEAAKEFFLKERDEGRVAWDSEAIWLTDQGFLFQNDVLVDFMLALEEGFDEELNRK